LLAATLFFFGAPKAEMRTPFISLDTISKIFLNCKPLRAVFLLRWSLLNDSSAF
jgi:hypothetical protein